MAPTPPPTVLERQHPIVDVLQSPLAKGPDRIPAGGPPVRLTNYGNTCFAAVAWHALRIVLCASMREECVANLDVGSVARTLFSLTQTNAVDVRQLFRVANSNEKLLFPLGQMGDPGEVVCVLLDKVLGEIITANPTLTDPLQTKQISVSVLTCSSCGARREAPESHHGITLPLLQGPDTSVEVVLNNFVAVERLDDNNRAICDECAEDGVFDVAANGDPIGTVNSKQISLMTWPDHLFLWFKRLRREVLPF